MGNGAGSLQTYVAPCGSLAQLHSKNAFFLFGRVVFKNALDD
jgi:hypothetical protein